MNPSPYPTHDPCVLSQEAVDIQAIHHVFINLIGMDQDSFKKVSDWLQFNGICRLEDLLSIPEYIADPTYVLNGHTMY